MVGCTFTVGWTVWVDAVVGIAVGVGLLQPANTLAIRITISTLSPILVKIIENLLTFHIELTGKIRHSDYTTINRCDKFHLTAFGSILNSRQGLKGQNRTAICPCARCCQTQKRPARLSGGAFDGIQQS
jgi:uncharacterized membrane protein YhiD involved in acid resistance